jgi:hypothetical protein
MDAVRAAFRGQAEWCRRGDAPFMAVLCDALADGLDVSSATGSAVLGWTGDPFADALMMRVTGGLNALVRASKAPMLAHFYPPAPLPDVARLGAALREAFADPAIDAALLPWLDGAPQTNEVARSGVLMPGLMVIADACGLPLRLFELGPSAGLNLCLDRWHYDLSGVIAGPDHAAVRIKPTWRGPSPPVADVRIAARRGVDLNPLDVTDPVTATRLLAYIWPDQPARVARAEAAIAAVAADPPRIDRGDAAAWVTARVAPEFGSVGVVFHSIAFQYFPEATRTAIAAHMAAVGATATADSPLAWLRYEIDIADPAQLPTLRLTLWRGAAPVERLLARAHPHGSFLEWFA